jgi:hypothetical protein
LRNCRDKTQGVELSSGKCVPRKNGTVPMRNEPGPQHCQVRCAA